MKRPLPFRDSVKDAIAESSCIVCNGNNQRRLIASQKRSDGSKNKAGACHQGVAQNLLALLFCQAAAPHKVSHDFRARGIAGKKGDDKRINASRQSFRIYRPFDKICENEKRQQDRHDGIRPDNNGAFGARLRNARKDNHCRREKNGRRKNEIGTDFISVHVTNLCGRPKNIPAPLLFYAAADAYFRTDLRKVLRFRCYRYCRKVSK